MLDLAKGDWVRLRSGELARVRHVDRANIDVVIVAVNGFGHTLWEEPSHRVSAETGTVGDVPCQRDIKWRVRRKGGFWGDKFVNEPLTLFRAPTTGE